MVAAYASDMVLLLGLPGTVPELGDVSAYVVGE